MEKPAAVRGQVDVLWKSKRGTITVCDSAASNN